MKKDLPPLQSEDIPIKRVKNTTEVIYSSAIAHKLAADNKYSATRIAAHIIAAHITDAVLANTFVPQNLYGSASTFQAVFQDISVRPTPSGFIEFKLGDRAIASWLNFLIEHLSQSVVQVTERLQPAIGQTNSQLREIFAIQHAHARCCSLLRLAHHQEFITLSHTESDPSYWRFIEPAAIPWLTSSSLCLTHSTEQRLISLAFTIWDEILQTALHEQTSSKQPSHMWKLVLRSAQELAQAFQAFYSTHPIVATSLKQLDLLHAQLGLVLLTQKLLSRLLEQLKIPAPVEL